MATYQPSPQDEGYSEAPLVAAEPILKSIWLSYIPAHDRIDFVVNIINQLPTSEICEVVRRVSPRLFIDFFHHLPPEVCLKILQYLDPVSLVNTARASKTWMRLALDRKLWERLYHLEGFRSNMGEVTNFEELLEICDPRCMDAYTSKGRARTLPALSTDTDMEMTDIDTARSTIKAGMNGARSQTLHTVTPRQQARQRVGSLPKHPSCFVVHDRSDGRRRMNWHYLFSIRKRLEANWDAEKYVNFQLPHPDFPEEAHAECIYTIQHSGNHLVSGSRDHTLRVWDIDSRRLMLPPLRGHTGSVLCLQFDPDPEEDIIVSGSSDATVVVWKFSTGRMLQRLKKAHRESVLNVRFDKNVLVTCSKDKTIKIFNRRPIAVNEAGLPVIVPGKVLNDFGFAPAPSSGLSARPAYSLIGCLDGHGAAVNAVQIHGGEIVSASGDRTVKVWDWLYGTCTRTLIGHQKGIACVQYDGRRIVSGSSDNEVKVFDRVSGLEVASLRAHTNLVRTVQAGFGDLPGSVEQDAEDARNIDLQYFRAIDAGEIPQNKERVKERNAGSWEPRHITAYGAKLPPGGGGGRLGRIVSGSYDETVIIWRRDREGLWKAQHRLRQEVAASAAAQERPPTLPPTPIATPVTATIPPSPSEPELQEFYRRIIDFVVPHGPQALQEALAKYPDMVECAYLIETIERQSAVPASRSALLDVHSQALQTYHAKLHDQSIQPTQTDAAQTLSTHASHATTSQAISSPANDPTTTATTTLSPPPLPTPLPQAQTAMSPASMARVFKLQFDARRIICCSQTPVIVGWDFANGDDEIIEASRFFAPVE